MFSDAKSSFQLDTANAGSVRKIIGVIFFPFLFSYIHLIELLMAKKKKIQAKFPSKKKSEHGTGVELPRLASQAWDRKF